MKDLPIGMFDSGLGGLTVMQQIVRALPYEDILYFGDTARLPYGEKSPETVVRYSLENAAFLIQKQIKMLIVACNTASAHALAKLQERLSIPVIGVLIPGAESAVKTSRTGRIGVLGTKGTIASQAYEKAILNEDPLCCPTSVACPLFVPLVEEGWTLHPAARLIVQEYLKPIIEAKVDTLLLGCTHYPFLKDLIRSEIGDQVAIVDSADSCAQKVLELLLSMRLQKESGKPSVHRFFVSDDPKRFQSVGSGFLGRAIQHVELVSLPEIVSFPIPLPVPVPMPVPDLI